MPREDGLSAAAVVAQDAMKRIEELEAERDRLQSELDIAKGFHNVAVGQRNIAWRENTELRAAVADCEEKASSPWDHPEIQELLSDILSNAPESFDDPGSVEVAVRYVRYLERAEKQRDRLWKEFDHLRKCAQGALTALQSHRDQGWISEQHRLTPDLLPLRDAAFAKGAKTEWNRE